MAVLPIRLFPEAVLRSKAKPVTKIDASIKKFIRDLFDTLYAQPDGIGIAAPQVGVSKQIIVVDVSKRDRRKRPIALINPHILDLAGETLTREGCMSLPDYRANLLRAERINVSWTDTLGRRVRIATQGIEALCIQHELDHLNGLLIVDRVTCLMTDVLPRSSR